MGMLRRMGAWLGRGRWIALLLLLAFVPFRAANGPLVESTLLATFDTYQWLSPRRAVDHPVLIVDIDEESLAAYGQWPWPRTLIAKMVDSITARGGVAIAFDMAFPEADRLNPDRLAAHLTQLDERARSALLGMPSNDEAFARSIAASRVVLGRAAYPKEISGVIHDDLPETPFATLGGDPSPVLRAFPGMIANVPVLERAAAGRGLFSLVPEFGGTIRRVPLIQSVRGRIAPSLSIELLRIAVGAGAIVVKRNALGVDRLVVGNVAIPTDEHARFWVHYANHDRIRYISAKDVIENTDVAARLKGKLVLVGTSAVGLFDLKATPVHPAMPGVEIHAQVLENILSGAYLSRPANAIGAEVLLALLVGIAVIVLVPILGALRVFMLGAAVAFALSALSLYAYQQYGLLVDVAYPLASSLVVFLVLVFTNYAREESQRRQIRSAFGQYLSPAMVEQLAQEPDRLKLGGEVRDLTLLFSDVRGFTRLSEAYMDDPEGLTTLINRLLTPLSNAIMERRGTIDKYIGDAIVAFWNAPLDDEDHAIHACQAALQMLDCIERLNASRREEAGAEGSVRSEPMRLGIGINTGQCVVGNLGSDLRFDYSVLGDSVNLTSRLENLTKTYGVQILVGPETVSRVRERFTLVELDVVRVEGRATPTVIHALVGDGALASDEAFVAFHGAWTRLLSLYRGRDWDAALALAGQLNDQARSYGLANVCRLYRDRAAALRTDPPADAWDFTFNTQKS